MRIGLFTHVYPPMINGIAISVKTLEEQLIKMGHEVFVITNNFYGFHNDFSNKNQLQTISIPIFYQNLRVPIIINPELFRTLKDLNLDVLHNHSDFGIGIISKIYSQMSSLPHIQTYHCNYFEYAKENFGNVVANMCKNPIKLHAKYIVNYTDRIISPSQENFRLLREDYNIKREIDLIPNGIELEKFKKINEQDLNSLRNKLGIKSNDFVLLSLSRLSKEKRIDEIIKLMPFLKECENLKLVIIGSGPEEEKLKTLASSIQLNNIIFTGEVQNELVPLYYNLASIFITNSIAETQGLTVIESLASGIPVVCINNPLYSNVIEKDKNGFLFNSDIELVKLIKSLYDNQNYLTKMKDFALHSASKYSIASAATKIVDLYGEEIINKRTM
jgi:Glycosyltransferase